MSRQAQSAIRLLGSLGYIYDGNNKWVAAPQSLDDALAAAPSAPEQPIVANSLQSALEAMTTSRDYFADKHQKFAESGKNLADRLEKAYEKIRKLQAAPEQPKQEGLTDEQITAVWQSLSGHGTELDRTMRIRFARALLASQPSEVVPPGHADGHPDWETAYKGLLASRPATTTAEYCWLVELFRGDGSGNSLGFYHTGFTDIGGSSRTTQNVYEAKRYTKEKAEKVAGGLESMRGTWKAVEHGFEASQPAAPDYTEIMLAARKAHADAHGNSLNPQKMLHWESGFMDGVKARCGMPAAPVAAEQEPKYSFEMPKGWINLLNPGQSWAEWTKQKGVPTTKGWLISGKPSAAPVEAATPANNYVPPEDHDALEEEADQREQDHLDSLAQDDLAAMNAKPEPAAVVGQDAGEVDGPREIVERRKTCNGCPALKTEDWTDYLENDETDSGTRAQCTKADKSITAYWSSRTPPPDWCPVATPAQAVPSESVDTPEFRNMLATWSKHNEDWRIRHASESMDRIIAHINVWHAAGIAAALKPLREYLASQSIDLGEQRHENTRLACLLRDRNAEYNAALDAVQAAQGQDGAVGAVCIFDGPDEIEWIGAVPPHGTKLYTRPQPPAQLSEPVGEVVDNVNGVWGVIYTDRKTPKAGTKLYIKE